MSSRPAQGRRVLLITGPAGAGKSSLAEAFAASRPQPTVLLHHDEVRSYVRSGRAAEGENFGAQALRQWQLAREVCIAALTLYLDAGFDCVVDAFCPGTDVAWRSGVPRAAEFRSFVLLPPLEVAIGRNARRRSRALTPTTVRLNYQEFLDHPLEGARVIDNSNMSICETVELLQREASWPTSS